MTSTDRSEYIKGLRALADALEANETLPLPWDGTAASSLTIFVDTKEELAAYAGVLTGTSKKEVSDGSYGFHLDGAVHGLAVTVMAPRGEVCERIVTGTKTVVREEPIISGYRSVPETVETVEWRCTPILSEATP